MKVVVAAYGTRGDVEPSVAVGRELLRRGHEVRMAVPPDLVGLVESIGLEPTPYGPELETMLGAHRDFWTFFFRNFWRLREVKRLSDEAWEPRKQCWGEMSRTLTSLAHGADLLFTGFVFEELAANVAEHYDIPLATLHYFPVRPNGQLLPHLPATLGRSMMTVHERMLWGGMKEVENEQRRELGLPEATTPSPRRVAERGSLEIQAYDEVCFPGLAAEWREWKGRRPFVGALTLELTTDVDQEIASWIAAGPAPIFFGFGSMPVESATEMLAMIDWACAQLGERALVCSAGTDFTQAPPADHVKVVPAANFAEVFPVCRAVVHHGGAGTTAAGLRAGVPQLILSSDLDQTLWGARVKRLRVGSARRFSATTRESLVADLGAVLDLGCIARAREISTLMTTPAAGVAAAAELLENFARLGRVG